MNSERISIFNLPHGVQQGADLDVLYPLGTVLAIREPLVTLSGMPILFHKRYQAS